MHLTAQTLTIIGIPLLGVPAIVICFCGLYYSLQASNNLKSDSKWPRSSGGMAQGYPIFIPRGEFTELGLYYRQRSFTLFLILLTWWIVILSYWFFAIWLIS